MTGGNAWPALYTSLDLATALGEIQRNIKLSGMKDYRFTEIWVQLEHVVDSREMPKTNRFLDDVDYSVGQSIAASAISQGEEAILVPSATLLGDNLVIFPDAIRDGSVMQIVRFIDPHLVKDAMS